MQAVPASNTSVAQRKQHRSTIAWNINHSTMPPCNQPATTALPLAPTRSHLQNVVTVTTAQPTQPLKTPICMPHHS